MKGIERIKRRDKLVRRRRREKKEKEKEWHFKTEQLMWSVFSNVILKLKK